MENYGVCPLDPVAWLSARLCRLLLKGRKNGTQELFQEKGQPFSLW